MNVPGLTATHNGAKNCLINLLKHKTFVLLNCIPEVEPDEEEHGRGRELESEVNVDRGGKVGPRGVRGGGVDQVAAEGREHDGAKVADEPLDAVVSPELLLLDSQKDRS